MVLFFVLIWPHVHVTTVLLGNGFFRLMVGPQGAIYTGN